MTEDPENDQSVLSAKARTVIAAVITLVWSVSVTASIVSVLFLDGSFSVDPWVALTMLGTVSAVFGSNFLKGIDRR